MTLAARVDWLKIMDRSRFGWILLTLAFLLQLPQVYLHLEKLSSHELIHLFGVDSHEKVPTSHSIVSPVKTSYDNGTSIFAFDFMDQRYVFSLTPVLIHDEQVGGKIHTCTYVGNGVSHPGSTLALVDCTGVKRGMIITQDGDILFIHPWTPSLRNSDTSEHVIYKRETWNLQPEPIRFQQNVANGTSLLDGERFSYARNGSYKNGTRLAVVRGRLTAEIALFADEKLWQHFEKIYGSTDAENELHSFVLSAVNNVNLLYNHHSLEPKLQLKIKRYQVLKNAPALLLERAHRSGDVDILLDNFCQYQDSFNPPHDGDPGHWDHALLFTGFDLYRGSLKTVAGYAPVKGMCSGLRSCTINEGLDFGSVFVITHEMGHSLGMYHDGDNGCDVGCCIMSPAVGAGKTAWSSCSVQEFNEFLNELGNAPLGPNCLQDGGSEVASVDHSLQGDYPGQRYNADEQCRFYHGSCWRQELREGQTLAEICDMIWCGEGEGVIRTAHPALEGTYCGENKWCLQGQCRAWPTSSIRPAPTHGSWTSWNDAPTDGCQLNCNGPCRVDGQITIRRSIRLCENPATNNGGKPCEGAAYRGYICSDAICRGPRPNEYASSICTGLRDGTSADGPTTFQLAGRGFQHQEQPCRIWCQLLVGSYARSVGNFPDGTPCGDNHFCVKGSCMKRSCGGLSLVMDDKDCPTSDEVLAPTSESRTGWTEWGLWSACSVTCGGGGRRQRLRSCQSGSCRGSSDQSQPCHAQWRCPNTLGTASADFSAQNRPQQQNFLNTWLAWSEWSQCDVTCGLGLQQRSRKCLTKACAGNALDAKECQLDDCPTVAGTWSTWMSWTECTSTCGSGTQERRRYCIGDPSCLGENVETQQCALAPCPVSAAESGLWGTWSSWSACSRTCAPGGAQYRLRSCSTSSCRGSKVSFSKCGAVECPDSNLVAAALRSEEIQGRWTAWTNWSGCSRTCGDVGVEQRVRTCVGSNSDASKPSRFSCQGQMVETRLCASDRCPTT